MRNRKIQNMFTKIYSDNSWGSLESRSGVGSEKQNSAGAHKAVQWVVESYGVSTIFDAPCGDFNWIQDAIPPELDYVGADVVHPLIIKLQEEFGTSKRKFIHLNLIRATRKIPEVDLIICRDLLVHLTLSDARKVINNFKNSGSRFLLITSFTEAGRTVKNKELTMNFGNFGWRPLNMEDSGFELNRAIQIFDEDTQELKNSNLKKCLALFDLHESRQ